MLLVWHRDLGLVASTILVVLLLTGSGLVFYATAGRYLNGPFDDPPTDVAAPSEPPGPPALLAGLTSPY